MHQHGEHLTKILTILHQNKFYLKPSKCFFAQSKVAYLKYVICDKGIVIDPKKIEAINLWPIIKNIKQLRAFLGLTGYYRKIISQYVNISAPLTNLFAKDQF